MRVFRLGPPVSAIDQADSTFRHSPYSTTRAVDANIRLGPGRRPQGGLICMPGRQERDFRRPARSSHNTCNASTRIRARTGATVEDRILLLELAIGHVSCSRGSPQSKNETNGFSAIELSLEVPAPSSSRDAAFPNLRIQTKSDELGRLPVPPDI